jgi:hypothetical protein
MRANLLQVQRGNVLGSSKGRSIKAPLTMFLVFLFASTMALRGNATHADTGQESNNVAETLLEMLNVTREEVNALLLSAGNNSNRVEDFAELLAEAEALNSEAHACLESGKYDLAVDTATEALNVYGRIASMIYASKKEENKPGGEDESVELVEHYARFEKALDRLNRYEEITDELASQELDVSDVLELILYAERLLSEMREGLEQEDFIVAESMHKDLEDVFNTIEDELQSRSQEKRRKNAERFVDETRDRVQRLETRYGQALGNQGIVDNTTGGVHEELLDMLSELEEVNAMIGEDELDEAVERLEDTINELKHLGRDQDRLGEKLIKSLNSLSEHSFLLRSCENRIRRLEGLGVDTVKLDELLKEIRRLLVDAGREIDRGRNDEAEDLIKGLDELLEVLGTQIKMLQEEADDSQGDDVDHEAGDKEVENEDAEEHKEINGTDKDRRGESDEDLNNTKRDADERETEAGEELPEDVEGDEYEEKEEDHSNDNEHDSRHLKVWLEKIKEKRAAYNRSRDKTRDQRRNVTELSELSEKTRSSSENREESGDEEPRASTEEVNEAVEGSEGVREKVPSEEEDEREAKDGKTEEEARDTEDLEKNSEGDELEEKSDTESNGPDEKSRKPEEKQEDAENDEREADKPEDGKGIDDDKPTEKIRKPKEKQEDAENNKKDKIDKQEVDEPRRSEGHRDNRHYKDRNKGKHN